MVKVFSVTIHCRCMVETWTHSLFRHAIWLDSFFNKFDINFLLICVVVFVWEVFILFDTVGLLHYQRVSISHLHILAKVSDFYWYSAKFIIGTISKQNSNSVDLLSDLWGKVCRAYNSYTVIIKIAVCPEPFFYDWKNISSFCITSTCQLNVSWF